MIFSLGLVFLNVRQLTSPVILHFDRFRAIDFFGQPADLWGIWLTGLIILLLNLFLSHQFFYRERALTYVLLGANLLIAILVLVALATIISVN